MKPRLSLVTLGVKDVAKAKDFYIRLGLVAHSMSNENVGFFDLNGVVLSVYEHRALAADATVPARDPKGFRGVSLAWNVSSQVEVDDVLRHAVAIGGRLVKPAQQVFWGGYSGYFADPDDHLWEVAHNPFVTFDEMGRVVLPQGKP